MDMQDTITLLDALARGAAAGASAPAQRRAAEAAESLARLAQCRPDICAALAADARVVPALAAAVCSRHADGAVVEAAMAAAAYIVEGCPAAARREQQNSLVRLGALQAAVQRLSAGGRSGLAAARLVGSLALERPDDLARAAVSAGALPGLVALMGDADASAAVHAAAALRTIVGHAGSPNAAAAVDAGAVPPLAALLARASSREDWLLSTLAVLLMLPATPTGAERLVAAGALPRVVGLLRSPAPGVAGRAVFVLAAATRDRSWRAVGDALLADARTVPALLALLSGPAEGGSRAPFDAAQVLAAMLHWGGTPGSPEAEGRARGLAVAIRRAGAAPRLVELLRAALEEDPRPAMGPMDALIAVCSSDGDAAGEAFDAGAWQLSCRILAEAASAAGIRFGELLLGTVVSLLAALACSRRRAPGAAAEPGLVAAMARTLGRVAARRSSANAPGFDAAMAVNAAAVVNDALEGADGAHCAAEFVQAGGVAHLVSARGLGLMGEGARRHASMGEGQPASPARSVVWRAGEAGGRAGSISRAFPKRSCSLSGMRALPPTTPSPQPTQLWVVKPVPLPTPPPIPQVAALSVARCGTVALRNTAAAMRALARHACGRAALVAAGAEAALLAALAAGSREGAVEPYLAEALEALRRPPEPGPGPAVDGPAAPRLCLVCGARGSRARPLKVCAGCRGPERWCSAECQRSSWAGHRAVCLERRAATTAAAAVAGSQGAV
jgi:hypothetical protein